MGCTANAATRDLLEYKESLGNQFQGYCDTGNEVFPHTSVSTIKYYDKSMCRKIQNVIQERELSLVVNGEPIVNLLCSGIALEELAYGFLFSEGVIGSLSEVRSFLMNKRTMTASFELTVPIVRPVCPTISSGFGGKLLYSLSSEAHGAPNNQTGEGFFTMTDIMMAVSTMRSFAREYTITRGIHCSALFKRRAPLASYEDIGRHNTFDKLAGRCLLDGRNTEGSLLTTTGRISGEMIRKALRLGVSGVASLSGPTDKAIAVAQDAGILLAGYVTDSSANVYTGM